MAYPTNVVHLATECGNKNHSAAFPEELPSWFIKLFTREYDTVLDPFMGSGTTLFAAKKLHRNSIGIDIQEEYCEKVKTELESVIIDADLLKNVELLMAEHPTKQLRLSGSPLDLQIQDVIDYVENNISVCHDKRLAKIDTLQLKEVLIKKNPYLFKAKNIQTAAEIIKSIVDAYISSSEETMFGDWLEGLAIFINNKVYQGWKSGIKGIDLEFDKGDKRYIVSIKSGPNWGNSSQIEKMENSFKTAIKTLRTSNSGLSIVCVNGCCYGKDHKPDKGSYFKYCGKCFGNSLEEVKAYTQILLNRLVIKRKNAMMTILYNITKC